MQEPTRGVALITGASRGVGAAISRMFAARGYDIVLVCHSIEDTITPRLLERTDPGYLAERRERQRSLPTVDEFAASIVATALDRSLASAHTTFVGGHE